VTTDTPHFPTIPPETLRAVSPAQYRVHRHRPRRP
jgi:hypothetical protein